MHIDHSSVKFLPGVLGRYLDEYRLRFQNLLSDVTLNADSFAPRVRLDHPGAVSEYFDQGASARSAILHLGADSGDISDAYASIIRDAVVWERLLVARRVELHRTRTVDPGITNAINEQLHPYDRLMKQPWLRTAPPAAVPQPRHYFPLHLIERSRPTDRQEERTLDEKFHILQAPNLFQQDLHEARIGSELRGISCAVAYVDVDEFKKVNTAYGEPFVDLNILPKLMSLLEAHTYQRGYAYRYGGDEYVILFHNTTADEAFRSIEILRKSIEQLVFLGAKHGFRITVSTGIVLIGPQCHLTGGEIESCAARAKQFAKDNGRNCIATLDAPWYDADRLVEG